MKTMTRIESLSTLGANPHLPILKEGPKVISIMGSFHYVPSGFQWSLSFDMSRNTNITPRQKFSETALVHFQTRSLANMVTKCLTTALAWDKNLRNITEMQRLSSASDLEIDYRDVSLLAEFVAAVGVKAEAFAEFSRGCSINSDCAEVIVLPSKEHGAINISSADNAAHFQDLDLRANFTPFQKTSRAVQVMAWAKTLKNPANGPGNGLPLGLLPSCNAHVEWQVALHVLQEHGVDPHGFLRLAVEVSKEIKDRFSGLVQ